MPAEFRKRQLKSVLLKIAHNAVEANVYLDVNDWESARELVEACAQDILRAEDILFHRGD